MATVRQAPSFHAAGHHWESPQEGLRGRQPRQGVPIGRSHSADARPQYARGSHDVRRSRNLAPKAESPPIARQHHNYGQAHSLPPSEPIYHDIERERLTSRSLSPESRPQRHGSTQPFANAAAPYQSSAYEQFWMPIEEPAKKQEPPNPASSMIFFSDAFETGSVLTGWSQQELIAKRKKEEANDAKRKEKNKYGKKKDKRKKEPRIINLPPMLPVNSPKHTDRRKYIRDQSDQLPAPMATQPGKRKNLFLRYSQLSKRTVALTDSAGERKSWNIMSKSSEESTHSSNGSLDVPAVDNMITYASMSISTSQPFRSTAAIHKQAEADWQRVQGERHVTTSSSTTIPTKTSRNVNESNRIRTPAYVEEEEPFPLLSTEAAASLKKTKGKNGNKEMTSDSQEQDGVPIGKGVVGWKGRVGARVRFAGDVEYSNECAHEESTIAQYSRPEDCAYSEASDDIVDMTPEVDYSMSTAPSFDEADGESLQQCQLGAAPRSFSGGDFYRDNAEKTTNESPTSVIPLHSGERRRYVGPSPDLKKTPPIETSRDESAQTIPQRCRQPPKSILRNPKPRRVIEGYPFETDIRSNRARFQNDYVTPARATPRAPQQPNNGVPCEQVVPKAAHAKLPSQGVQDEHISRKNDHDASLRVPQQLQNNARFQSEQQLRSDSKSYTRSRALQQPHDNVPSQSAEPGQHVNAQVSHDEPVVETKGIALSPPRVGAQFTDRDGVEISPIGPDCSTLPCLPDEMCGDTFDPNEDKRHLYFDSAELNGDWSVNGQWQHQGKPLDDFRSEMVDDSDVSSDVFGFIEAVAAVVIQTAIRRHRAIVAVQEMRVQMAAVVIQTAIRRYLAIVMVEETFAEVAAVVIQTAIRRHLAIVAVGSMRAQAFPASQELKFENMAERMYNLAAVQVQAAFRGWWVRDSLHVDHYCATKIQRVVRAFLCRMNYLFDVYRILVVQSIWRRNLAQNVAFHRFSSILAIQSTYRAYKSRQELGGIRGASRQSEGDVVTTHALPTAKQASVVTRGANASLQRINLKAATAITSVDFEVAAVEHDAATVIQAQWRMYDAQMNFLHSLADILIVQSVARRWIVQKIVAPYVQWERSRKGMHANFAVGIHEMKEAKSHDRRDPGVETITVDMVRAWQDRDRHSAKMSGEAANFWKSMEKKRGSDQKQSHPRRERLVHSELSPSD